MARKTRVLSLAALVLAGAWLLSLPSAFAGGHAQKAEVSADNGTVTVVAAVAALGAAAAAGAAVGAVFAMLKLVPVMQALGQGRAGSSDDSAKKQGSGPVDPDASMGFSMEEARNHADAGQKESISRSPGEVLTELQRGNTRFWMGAATRPEKSAFERRALITKQFPCASILGCADSRVPVEIVFDQGLGDLFVVRVAGNCLTDATQGSLQYSVHHLKVKVLVVMGHEFCGAIKASGLPNDVLEKESPALCTCLKTLKGSNDWKHLGSISDPRAKDREAVIANVNKQIEGLTKDEGIMKKVDAGELIIVGAFYEISSGIVDFFSEVSSAKGESPSRGVLTRFGK